MIFNDSLKKRNILQILFILLLSFLLFLPLNYFVEYYTHHLVFITLVFLIGLVNRFLYYIFSLVISIFTIFIIHIEYNWGGGFVEDRIAVILESPSYESLEYLKVYISNIDIFLILYFILLNIVSVIVIKEYKLKIVKYLALIGILFIGLFINYKQVAIMTNPSVYISVGAINGMRSFYQSQNNRDVKTVIEENIKCSEKFNKILIVIGEAVRKDNMSFYGYKRKTTPFFDSLEGLIKLNAIAPSNQTRSSVPMLITHGRVNNSQDIFRRASLIEELKRCGYETYWISNQAKIGKHDTDISALARKADNVHFVNKEINKVATYDELIYEYMKTLNTKSTKKEAFFLHFIGSHQYYNTRIPKNYNPFGNKKVINSYDNTIHYTDMLLSKIFNLFKKEKLLFVYTSDHGEVVTELKSGHGFIPAYKDEYLVPLVLWGEDINDINNNQMINTESFNYLIRYLVGIDNKIYLSYSQDVIEVNLKNIKKFGELEYYEK